MPLDGYNDLKVREVGGLNTLLDPTNLPHFMSPDCPDVEFFPGLVRSRPGFTSQFAPAASSPQFNYTKSYIDLTKKNRTMELSSLGSLYYEDATSAPGILNLITSKILPGAIGNSVTLFGREYIAFSDGQNGVDIPRQFDGTNLDRVSQEGPGEAPDVTDEVQEFTIQAAPTGLVQVAPATIAAGPTGATQVGNVVTITLSAGTTSGMQVNDNVKVAGVGVAGYNGTFAVTAVLSPTQFQYIATNSGLANSGGGTVDKGQVTVSITGTFPAADPAPSSLTVAGATLAGYNGTWRAINVTLGGATAIVYTGTFGLAASGGGTIAYAGNIIGGTHEVSVFFRTRSGYETAPAPVKSFTTSGGRRLVVTNIPIGPPNVVARVLCFSAAGGDSFFYTDASSPIPNGNMVINDNTTTSTVVDFDDQALLDGVNVDDHFELVVLGPCAGVTEYANRLAWWGEVNNIKSFQAMAFDGGFQGNAPLGWDTSDANFPGGQKAGESVFGDAYAIQGDGATAIRGMIKQSAASNSSGSPLIQPSIGYSVKLRLERPSGGTPFAAGTLHVELYSASAGILQGATFNLTTLTTSFALYSGVITAGLASIPPDLQLRVYADGTPTAGAQVNIDEMTIYPTNQPYTISVVRLSNPEDAESYDGVAGFLQPSEGSGQAVFCCFRIRDFFYVTKERSLFVTRDDGQNQPANWEIAEVSSKVGTTSIRGVAMGDEWCIICGESGAWYFDGGQLAEDNKICTELQPTWNSIQWVRGYLLDGKIDTKRKRVYIAAPGANSAYANMIITVDYTQGWSDGTANDGQGRKWSVWNISSASLAMILRNDGVQRLWIGNGAFTGKVYQLDDTYTVHSDDGVAIPGYWESGFFQDSQRLNFGYVVANVVGVGTCTMLLKKGDQGWKSPIRGWAMNLLAFTNMERQIQKQGYRMSITFGTALLNEWFSLQGFTMYVQESMWSPVRGINS